MLLTLFPLKYFFLGLLVLLRFSSCLFVDPTTRAVNGPCSASFHFHRHEAAITNKQHRKQKMNIDYSPHSAYEGPLLNRFQCRCQLVETKKLCWKKPEEIGNKSPTSRSTVFLGLGCENTPHVDNHHKRCEDKERHRWLLNEVQMTENEAFDSYKT